MCPVCRMLQHLKFGARWGGCSSPRPGRFTPGKDPVPFIYRGADKFLARPGRKQVTATEDFEFHVSYL